MNKYRLTLAFEGPPPLIGDASPDRASVSVELQSVGMPEFERMLLAVADLRVRMCDRQSELVNERVKKYMDQ